MQKSCCTRWNRGKYGDPWLKKKKKKKNKRKKRRRENRTRSSTRRKIEISIGLDVTMMLEYSCPNGNAFAGSLHLSVFHDPLHCRYNRSTELVTLAGENPEFFHRNYLPGNRSGVAIISYIIAKGEINCTRYDTEWYVYRGTPGGNRMISTMHFATLDQTCYESIETFFIFSSFDYPL